MTGFGDIMKQAQAMKANMEKMQEEMLKMEVTGESGAGLVKVIMNGRHDVKKVTIDPDVLKEEKEMLEDLLAAAVNDAVRKIEENAKGQFGNMAQGLNLDGFKWPF